MVEVEYAAAGPVRRALRQLVTLPAVAGVSARLLPAADRLAVNLTGGRSTLSGWVTGLPIVELTTTGARSGQPRRSRVMAVPTRGGKLVVAANFGGPRDPAWCHNLRTHPAVDVDDRPHRARELHGHEHADALAAALRLNPGWRRFQHRAGRPLPVFELLAGADPG